MNNAPANIAPGSLWEVWKADWHPFGCTCSPAPNFFKPSWRGCSQDFATLLSDVSPELVRHMGLYRCLDCGRGHVGFAHVNPVRRCPELEQILRFPEMWAHLQGQYSLWVPLAERRPIQLPPSRGVGVLLLPDRDTYPDQIVFQPPGYLVRERRVILPLHAATRLLLGDPLPGYTALDTIAPTSLLRLWDPPRPEGDSTKIIARAFEGVAIAVTKLGGVRQFPIRELVAPHREGPDSTYIPPAEHGEHDEPHYQSYLIGGRVVLVPVIGKKRAAAALRDPRFAELLTKEYHAKLRAWIGSWSRVALGRVFYDEYQKLFWKEAWAVAKRYGWDRNQASGMAQDAFARFACGDLFQRGFALQMAPAYDPAAGFTPGAFVRRRIRQAIHEEAREISADVVVPRGKQFAQTISRDAPCNELLGAHLVNVSAAIDYERLDRLFTAEGKFDWGGVPVNERKALHRHFDVVAIINAAHYEWRYSAGCRAKPKLFGEARSAAYAPGRVSVDKRTAVPDRIDEDVMDIARVQTVTGNPDWQPRIKPHSARQVIGCRHPLGMKHEAVAHLKAIADRARLAGHPIRFEEWLSWEAGVLPIGMRKDKKDRMTVIYGPGLVRYPRCAKDLYGWSWEYRRKQRRIIRNRVAVFTHMGGREAAPWTPEDEARERAIQAAEYRRREIIMRLAQPVTEKTRYPAVVLGES